MKNMYDFEPELVKRFLEENQVEKVAVEMPAGLRPYIGEIEKIFRDEGCETLYLADSCYGACDVSDEEAERLGCDALVHFGHSDMSIPTSIPTLFVPARMEVEPFETLEKALPELRESVWGLTATVQHVHCLDEVKEYLEEEGVNSVIGEPGPRSKYRGQILGCDWGSGRSVAGKVDGFIYIGSGSFHPLGLFLATEKRVVSVNPVSGDYQVIEQEIGDFLRKRAVLLDKIESSESIGILVSTKKGQNRMRLAKDLAEDLMDSGYECFLLVMDELNPDILKDYRLDGFVNTACPRIPLSDEERYEEPILTPFEAKVLIGEEDWEAYRLDEIGRNFEK